MFATIAMLIFSAAAALQGASGGVAVAGVVQDQTGAVVPDAKVSLLADGSSASPRTTATDTSGSFHFDQVPAGNFVLQIEFPGFKSKSVVMRVGSRPPARQTIVLEIEGVTQEVSVTNAAQATADTSGNLNAIAVDATTLDNLPVLDEDVVGAMSRFLDSSAIGTGGATLIVDGVEVSALKLSASAIQQIKINQDPYAAEFMRPGRGRIEIVTKPGGRDYSGSLNLRFRDSDFNARNPFATVKPPEQRRSLEGTFGGPLPGTEKTNIMVSGSYSAEDNQALVHAQTLTGPVDESLPTPQRNLLFSATWSHMAGERTMQSIRFSHLHEQNANQGVGGVNLPEVATQHTNREDELIFSQQTIVSTQLLHEIRVLLGDEREPRISARRAGRIVVQDAFTGGGAQTDTLRTEHHFTVVDATTWTHGRQTLKFGLNIPDWSWRGFVDWSNTVGTFSFASLNDYAAGRAYSFTQQAGDGHVDFLEKVVALFVQDDVRVRPNLSIDVGLRYDWQSYFGDRDNFAPRLSFAYAPGDGARRTVIRGGTGVFYDRTGEGPIRDLIRYDGNHLLRYVIVDPSYPDPLGAGQSLSSQPSSLVVLAPDAVIPFTVQYSIGVERQLHSRTTLAVNFIGARGVDMFRSRDINAPPPPTYASRPDPSVAVVRQIESRGRLETAALQFTIRGPFTRLFSGSAEYTYGRASNDTSGINWMPPNNYDLSLEYARADFNQRHRLEMFGAMTPRRQMTLSLSASLATGRPYSLTTGQDLFNTGIANARPAGVPRNSLTGPPFATVDARWSREFDFLRGGEKRSVTAGIDAFNVLNHVNFNTPVGNLSSPFFMQSTSAQAARRLQLSLRFRY